MPTSRSDDEVIGVYADIIELIKFTSSCDNIIVMGDSMLLEKERKLNSLD